VFVVCSVLRREAEAVVKRVLDLLGSLDAWVSEGTALDQT
jgi:hypothetical protein